MRTTASAFCNVLHREGRCRDFISHSFVNSFNRLGSRLGDTAEIGDITRWARSGLILIILIIMLVLGRF